MERELKGMERTILISNDIRPFNFQAVRTAITSLQIPLTPKLLKIFRSETKGMERELKGMERTILISNDIRPFNFQAVRTAITSLQIPLTPKLLKIFRSETKGMERELKGMERTILISNDIRPFNFQAVRTAITSLQIPLTPEKIINYQLSILN